MVHVGHATAAALAKYVQDVAVAVTLAVLDFVATTFVNCARPIAFSAFVKLAHALIYIVADAVVIVVGEASASAHAQGVFDIAVAVAFAVFDFVAAAFKNSAGTVAFPAFVNFTDAIVFVVANAVAVQVLCTITAACAQGIFGVAFAIAIPGWDVRASAFVHVARSVAHAAGVERSDTFIHVVTDAVFVLIRCT